MGIGAPSCGVIVGCDVVAGCGGGCCCVLWWSWVSAGMNVVGWV